MAFDFTPLRDGQRLEAGNVLVDVLHTPGHTPDSICLSVRDLGLGAAAALGGRIESAFWFVAIAMAVSGVVLYRWGEETHPRLNPAR